MPSALVVSPFATWPDDAGQRKRARQTTKMLADAGYDITFVLYAFEDLWRWRWDDEAVAKMREDWGEVYVYPAPERTGGPPANRDVHGLDEWWDGGFEAYLEAMSRLKRFDVVVVHNVWLSKALDIFPKSTVKVIDTHDFFSVRAAMMRRNGIPMEFFTPRDADEVFGLNRADVIWAIQAGEAEEMIRRAQPAVRYLPYLDAELIDPAADDDLAVADGYLSEDRVRFGFIGGGSVFNTLGVQKIVAALTEQMALAPAPVELVLAGSVCNAFDPREFHHVPLGYVDDEEDFYAACDVVIVPIFDGTGMKVKAIDSLSRRRPLLLSAHAATGLDMPDGWVFSTPEAMAKRMCAIAFHRPPLKNLRLQAETAYNRYRDEYRRRQRAALWAISEQRAVVDIDVSDAKGEEAVFATLLAFSYARFLAGFATVTISGPADLMKSLEMTAPPGCRVRMVGEDDADSALADEAALRITVRPSKGRVGLDVTASTRGEEDETLVVDHISQGMFWEPSILKLARRFKASLSPDVDDNPKRYLVGHSTRDVVLTASTDYLSPTDEPTGEEAPLALVSREFAAGDRLSALGALHAIYNGAVESVVILDASKLTPRDQIVLSIAGGSGVELYDDATGVISRAAVQRRFTELEHRNVTALERLRATLLEGA